MTQGNAVSTLQQGAVEVIDVIAWVFIWEAIDIAFIERLEHSNQVKMANNIIESKIVFSKLDDN